MDIKLFKYPEDLIKEIEKGDFPDLFGVSNYIWNHNLSSLFCKIIKKSSNCKIVMGGPNFPTVKNEQEEFLKNEPWIDFYITKEAEYSLSKLVESLLKINKTTIKDVPNLVYLKDGKLLYSEKIEKLWI